MMPMQPDQVKQPNSRNCFACGLHNPIGLKLEFFESGPDEVCAIFQPSPDYEGFPGVLHGGVVAALLDEIGGRAAMIGNHDHFRMTAKLEVRYRAPTPIDRPLTVRGRLVTKRGRLAIAHAEVCVPDGTVTADAGVTLADIPDGTLPPGALSDLGWKVYD